MSVVAAAVVLFALVLLLVRWRQAKPSAAVVCVLAGLVLGATPAGPAVNAGVSAAGSWVWAKVAAL